MTRPKCRQITGVDRSALYLGGGGVTDLGTGACKLYHLRSVLHWTNTNIPQLKHIKDEIKNAKW